jgi:tetratricopeptide (TPR) repeat protein
MSKRSGALALALAISGWACGPSVTVTHLQPAPYNLGPARRLVLVEVGGSYAAETRLANAFLAQIAGGGVLTIQDATRESVRLASLGSGAAARDAREFRRKWPADVYVGIGSELQSRPRSERHKKKTDDGEVEVVRHWVEAECEVRVRLLDAADGRELASFSVSQSGESARADGVGSNMRADAEDRAIESAVADAVSQFAPRMVSERISLDKEAPLGEAGLKLVEAGDLAGARRLWEKGLEANGQSAPLRYNLGALCEALRDRRSARQYYEDAIRLNPAESKYREALDALEARRRDTKALKNPG